MTNKQRKDDIEKLANEFVKSSKAQKLKLLNDVKSAVLKLYQHCNNDYLGLCFSNKKISDDLKITKQLSNYASWSYFNVVNLKSLCEKLEKEFSRDLTDKMFHFRTRKTNCKKQN